MEQRKFPTAIKLWKYEIERKARKLGRDFPDTIYEIVSREEMFALAAYNGFPVRWHHWTFGQEYIDYLYSGKAGMVIFEMIINTDPCFGYLFEENTLEGQKAVITHATGGHGDFFKNNMFFHPTPKKMHNVLADHASVLDRLRTEFGREKVDEFLEACMSLDTLIDLLSPFINRFPRQSTIGIEEEKKRKQPQRIVPDESLPTYMDKILNPPAFIEEQRKRIEEEEKRQSEVDRGLRNPPWPVNDVLGFLLLHAPLEPWQLEILRIVREEHHFFMLGAQTKIMNEGWAALTEENILVQESILKDGELCPFAKTEAGVLRAHPGRVNPYELGVKLWKDILFRWDTGRHGDIWEDCKHASIMDRWDEFAVCKALVDRHGDRTPAFWKAWDEFCALMKETYENRGSYPGEYFGSQLYVTEWLLYDRAQSELPDLYTKLEKVRVFEEEMDALLPALREKEGKEPDVDEEMLRFKARHDLWLEKGSDRDFLWSSDELLQEIRRREELVALRKRLVQASLGRYRIPIPEEWFVWAKKNPSSIELGKGIEKIFEVRKMYSDVSFIDEFFTLQFCEAEGYFTFGIEHDHWIPGQGEMDVYTIRSRNYERVKRFLKNMFLNLGMPRVELEDANFNNNRELLLRHLHDGRDLDERDLKEVLKRLYVVWGGQKGVHLETVRTTWPARKPWWDRWHPWWLPPPPPPKIERRRVRYSCSDGKYVGTSSIS